MMIFFTQIAKLEEEYLFYLVYVIPILCKTFKFLYEDSSVKTSLFIYVMYLKSCQFYNICGLFFSESFKMLEKPYTQLQWI